MSEERPAPRNRLAEEASPYLLQHKDNPVAWRAWSPEAFAEAKQANKPVLLSVGYAACHWCHVMAHESFENEEIAGIMNQLFVNIKVDREERPDLDTIYQHALALLGQHGGWPLTMFLTPECEPFWGGTYFPPEPRFGRPGFAQVLRSVAEAYRKSPDHVATNVAALREALAKLSRNQEGGAIRLEITDQVAERMVREIDPVNGGLGSAPKFPQPSILELLWRAWKRSKGEPFRHAVELTLTKMCQGGIYDHLGGGFARYSVDEAWLVPHFEKMLYDNAQLIDLLTWVWQETADPLYEARVRETVDWVLREMIAPDRAGDGFGFASTLDADSEGEEGKFYVWSEAEIDEILGAEAAAFKAAYDVSAEGNWEGKTILNRTQRPDLGSRGEEAALVEMRQKLLLARARRVRPGWDDKVLADWNGLMIAALANAAPAFDEPGWLAAAETAFGFVAENLTRDGRLMHSWRHGKLNHPATLDDYANLCRAALALYEATGGRHYLSQAEAWVEVVERHYRDREAGGYFFTADDTEGLIVRTKTVHDSATPAGNGTLAEVLARLYFHSGEARYRQAAEALVAAFSGEVNRNFMPLSTLFNGNEILLQAQQIVILGAREAPDTQALLGAVHGVSLPNRVLAVVSDERLSQDHLPQGHPAHGKDRKDGRATAYVCRGPVCSLPITDPAELALALAT
jgi:uncharacterized protein YyaL (SSP411 family)